MPLLIQPAPPARVVTSAAEVVFLYDDGLVTRTGRLLVRRGSRYEVELELTPPEGAVDMRVVLSVLGDSPRRVPGRVAAVQGRRLVIEGRSAVRSDKRRFPRLPAAIPLRWRPVREAEGAWHEPDPFMNFSVVGFSFGGRADDTQEGDLLTLDFAVPPKAARFAGLARVVRVAEREAADVVGDETHEISVELVEAPAAAREALGDLTLRIQRALTDPT